MNDTWIVWVVWIVEPCIVLILEIVDKVGIAKVHLTRIPMSAGS